MNYSQFQPLPAEQERRLAAECIDLFPIYLTCDETTEDALLSMKPNDSRHQPIGFGKYIDGKIDVVYERDDWKPDLSLDQCALLIAKAKESMEVWSKFDSAIHDISFGKQPYRSLGFFNANIAALSADEILFALLEAFGKLERKET